jgi:thioredoxin-like negative regulator of GroEL
VATALASYVPVKIDFDASPSMVAAYGVKAIPAYVIINKSGDVVRPATEGAMGPEEFVAWLDRGPDAGPAAATTAPATTRASE